MTEKPKRKRSESRRPGRPKGSPNRDYAAGQTRPSQCPKCQSTRAASRQQTAAVDSTGEHQGQPYNRVELHRVKCADCGQHRIDRTFHFIPRNSENEYPASPPAADAA